ncbi:hypothetical protein [Streptomyces sp. NPDC054783]
MHTWLGSQWSIGDEEGFRTAVAKNDASVGRRLTHHRARTVLVRPDKVVCAAGRTRSDMEER